MNGPLADLHDSYGRDGYLGGLRLLQATCKKFYQASFSCPTYQKIVLGTHSVPVGHKWDGGNYFILF